VDSVALVYQQAAVLRNNIDQKVTHLFGAMGLDLWSKVIWLEYFKESMVIVCTADILHQCLLSSYITIENINLLIFDEAHHTKKEHAYAR
jgi:endoribonuclease Dicer